MYISSSVLWFHRDIIVNSYYNENETTKVNNTGSLTTTKWIFVKMKKRKEHHHQCMLILPPLPVLICLSFHLDPELEGTTTSLKYLILEFSAMRIVWCLCSLVPEAFRLGETSDGANCVLRLSNDLMCVMS